MLFWLGVGVVLVVSIAAVTLKNQWHRLFPSGEASEVYARYAGEEGINAAYVKGYRINDSMAVDVTLLEAADSAGWARLCVDFSIPKTPDDAEKLQEEGYDIIWTRYGCADDPCKSIDETVERWVVVTISPKMRAVSVFHTTDNEQAKNIFIHNLRYDINQCKK